MTSKNQLELQDVMHELQIINIKLDNVLAKLDLMEPS
jgi:hypothetical protein